jgi:hypothetical protein
MFTYTSLFLVSLLVAVVGRMVYKSMAEKSGSVYNTKLPTAELAHLDKPVKRTTKADEGINTAYPTDLRNRGTYAYLSNDQEVEAIDVQIAEDIPHEWPQSVHAVPIDHSKREESHCSLFELDSAEPDMVREPAAAWPQREEKAEAGGKAYKVTRKVTGKVATENVDLDADAKPWGW